MTEQTRSPTSLPGALAAADYRHLFYAFDQGFCVFEVLVDDDGQPCDYRFLEVNHLFEQYTGLVDPVGRTALELVPNLERSWIEVYGRVAMTGERLRFTQGSPAMGGRWFDVYASRIGGGCAQGQRAPLQGVCRYGAGHALGHRSGRPMYLPLPRMASVHRAD